MSLRSAWPLFIALACHGAEPVSAPAPIATIEPTPTPAPEAFDPARRCGEAGREPTELPPGLTATQQLGSAVLRVNETRTIGTVVVQYDPNMQVAPVAVGHRAPALSITMDRAEAHGGAWGTFAELHPDRPLHRDLGPYSIDARPSADLAEVVFTVARRACPDAAQIPATTEPLALWLSTDAIRVHTYDPQGELLQVSLAGDHETPRLDVSNLGYRQWFEPRPGELRTVRVGGHNVIVDRVVPGPNTRHGDHWTADEAIRVHARVRIEPAPAEPLSAATATRSACGDVSPVRTTPPTELAAMPRAADDITLSPGRPRKLGPLQLELRQHDVSTHARAGEPIDTLEVRRDGATRAGVSLGPGTASQLVRVDRDLLRVDPDPKGLRVRRFALACPDLREQPAPTRPIHVWLGTLGVQTILVGDPDRPALSLALHADVRAPTLVVSSAQASLSRTLLPDLVGVPFTLDGQLVEVVDLETGPDTTPGPHGWSTTAAFPAVHVQIRVTPAT